MPARTKSSVVFLLSDDRLRRLLSERFIELGWKVTTVASADEAMRRAMSTPPKLIVGDEHMLSPETVAHFGSLPTLHEARVVLLVSLLPIAVRDAYVRAGAASIVLLGTMSLNELERLLISTSHV